MFDERPVSTIVIVQSWMSVPRRSIWVPPFDSTKSFVSHSL